MNESKKTVVSNEASLVDDVLRHPLMMRSEILLTPAIEFLCRRAKRIVLLREVGVYFTADSGAGKSMALEALELYLSKFLSDVRTLIHDSQNQQVTSIRAFFKGFLATLDHKDGKGETYDLKRRVCNRLIEFGYESKYRLVILLIDEAQTMSLDDFRFLKDVSNALDRRGIQLLTILMAQDPDFEQVIKQFHDHDRLDLVSRFAISRIPFPGFRTIEDLQAVLTAIDTKKFPEGEKFWLEPFFPKAFKAGFRIVNEAANLLHALIEAFPSGKQREFPVRQTFLAIRIFLLDNAAYDSAEMRLPQHAWSNAIAEAKVQDAAELAGRHRGRSNLKVKK